MRGRSAGITSKGAPFGWSFLLAWVFCVFYLEIAGPAPAREAIAATGMGPAGVVLMVLPLAVTILCLAIAILVEPLVGPPAAHPSLYGVATAACAAGTPLLYAPDASMAGLLAAYVAGAVATGVGSAFLWVLWGEFYARLPQEDAEGLAPLSTAAAVLLIAVVVLVDGWWRTAVSCAYVLAAGWMCWQCRPRRDDGAPSGRGEGLRAPAPGARRSAADGPRGILARRGSVGRGSVGIFAACLFVCLLSDFFVASDVRDASSLLSLGASLVLLGPWPWCRCAGRGAYRWGSCTGGCARCWWPASGWPSCWGRGRAPTRRSRCPWRRVWPSAS